MKKIIKFIIVILLLFMGFIIVNKSNDNDKILFKTEYYIATTELNVRVGAGTKYAISFTLQKGDEVEILSKKSNWYQVKFSNQIGYANSKYLKFNRTFSKSDVVSNYISNRSGKVFFVGIFVIIIIIISFNIFNKKRNKKLLETVTKLHRGTSSERNLVLKLLKNGIPAENIFHDLYVDKWNGGFSQIDLVVVTSVGIIVFEVKDYSGWIFGSGNNSQWTQVLAYGKQKYRFYNPIMQNKKHIEDLRKRIQQFENVPLYSVIIFYGKCVLKEVSCVPSGTFIEYSERSLEIVNCIFRNNKPVEYSNKDELIRVLKDAVMNGESSEIQNQHIANIQNMLGKR